MTRILSCFVVVFGLLAGACGSSPPVRYYSLDPLPGTKPDVAKPYSMGLGPIVFPEYLRRPQIVTRTVGAEIKFADFDRWSGPLAGSFQRILVQNLDQLLDEWTVVEFPYGTLWDPQFRFQGRVTRFDTDETGLAVLNVQWGVRDLETEQMLVRIRRDEYTAQAADPGDYDSIVRALNATVEDFSRTAAVAISEQMGP